MIKVILPDGSIKEFTKAQSVFQVAESIGERLAKAAVAAAVDGKMVDMSHQITTDCKLKLFTERDNEGLEVLRHSAAHLLAHAVSELHPEAQVTIGPVIEDGFYYDFAYSRSFTPEDMQQIEDKMHEIASRKLAVIREEVSREDAIALFANIGEDYKVQIIRDLPGSETITIYRQGDFIDLCRGPHVPHTGFLKAFKLMKIAGAYWRGNSDNEMLQRIYGTAWANKDDLNAYITRIEEAKKRDHRLLGAKMDLFHFQDIAPGLVFWHENGWIIYQELCKKVRKLQRKYGYSEINTPMLVDRSLWEKSGHWSKYSEEMFTVHPDPSKGESRVYAIKPMSCPCHVETFKQALRSYRDLPIRYAEFGCCHRFEPSGALHGLMRVRGFTQDDSHIFCTEEQIGSESAAVLNYVYDLYKEIGFTDVQVKLSTRPENRIGEDALWDLAESTLAKVLDDAGIAWEELPGEGAFYGPKIEFSLKDCLGRVWQCGTLQLDFFMPKNLGATYIDAADTKKTPVMLHRAGLGSLERIIGVILENTEGWLPLWLAPIQLICIGVSEKHSNYVVQIAEKMQKNGFRAKYDLRNEKIGFKIREHTIARVPNIVIIGDKEEAESSLTVRNAHGEQQSFASVDDFVDNLRKQLEMEE
jgi:threonyl-tRNA synthetase